ncbi:transglutaminaseTgpA domain-containing protein [Rossellomorea marisflavi]|uniref:transglutaminaseTgpA domain-containing protein n=1 Tax=Rossellomorea marisflavi TaxID=189381 RepID=UPI0034591C16
MKNQTHHLINIIIYGLGFLLLWEWLRPVGAITDTGSVTAFVLFIAMAFLLSYFRVPFLISGAVKLLYMIVALKIWYFPGSIFDLTWVQEMFGEIGYNTGMMFSREWGSLTYMYQSLLFFILLWLMTYLLHYWLMVRRSILLFYFMTITYICVIDTYTEYDGKMSILRAVIIGFILMGMLALERLVKREGLALFRINRRKWMVPLVILLGCSSVLALAAPKAAPIWPDPIPYLESLSANGTGIGGGGNSKAGYDPDDSRLGGPFEADPSVVFTAEVTDEHYWKIETKDFYTGKGWEQSRPEDEGEEMNFQADELVPISDDANRDKEEAPKIERVMMASTYSHILYPYGLEKIILDWSGYFSLNPVSEKITSREENGSDIELNQYEVSYHPASYSLKKMKGTVDGDIDSEGFLERYTQLPENLPERVSLLAEEITKDKDNWYDKVKAIERYFGQNGFVYDQQDVAVPGAEQDYVDQFLFETQKGYCDNFSTSMVAMTRSLGIPARWVKGYTEGTFSKQVDKDYQLFEVTNDNAHSWVEVFFPGVGWVPFEPTVGFSNNVRYAYDLELDDSEGEETSAEDKEETPAPESQQQQPQPDLANEDSSGVDGAQSFLQEHTGTFFFGLMAILLLIGVGYYLRRRWIPYLYILYYRTQKSESAFPKAYLALVKQLERHGVKMEDGQTLRSYSHYVDTHFGMYEMTSLTNNYERLLYGRDLSTEEWVKLRKLWENLIKKTTG